MKAAFDQTFIFPGREEFIVYIVDRSNDRSTMTVTNDAEAVYNHIREKYKHRALGRKFRLIYRDTDHKWDEIEQFMGTVAFKPFDGPLPAMPALLPYKRIIEMPSIDHAAKGVPLEPTQYAYEAAHYARKAHLLQDQGNLGGTPYTEIEGINDDLMQQVTIYDCVERKHAGFSNVLQDLWHGDSAPKFYKWAPDHQAWNTEMNSNQGRWTLREWLFLFLVHRMTGSGASFEKDHGYRNTILPELAKYDTVEEMHAAMIRFSGGPEKRTIFTSIGNQIPAMPKPFGSWETNAQTYFGEYSLQLVNSLANALPAKKRPMQKLHEMMLNWNTKNDMRRFKFPYAAMVADLADYFPEYVDPHSDFMHGKNAEEALALMFRPTQRMSKQRFLDLSLRTLSNAIGGHPYDIEDVCCDSIRFVENYIPLNKMGTYDHLCLDTVFGNPKYVEYHEKGRQKWHISHGVVDTHNGQTQFGDYAVLDRAGLSVEEGRNRYIRGPIK